MNKPEFPKLESPRSEKVVSDEMIDYFFDGCNFGGDNSRENHRKELANAVLKTLAGWWNGHTIYRIMVACDLVVDGGDLTKRGKLFAYEECKINIDYGKKP